MEAAAEAAFSSYLLHLLVFFLLQTATTTSDPQTHFVTTLCGPFAAADSDSYFSIVNATLPQLRSDLTANPYDASAQAPSTEPVFLFFQCRQYLPPADCLACYDAAAALIPRCYPMRSGNLVLDGCSLGYQSNSKRVEPTSNWSPISICEDRVVGGDNDVFGSTVKMAMEGLVRGVPKRERLFGVAEEKVGGASSTSSSSSLVVYAVGQCVTTEIDDFCGTCLQTSYENLKGCPPAAGGRSASLGCFLRYSDQPFFNSTQIALVPIAGHHKRKLVIVIACTGAATAALCLILLLLLLSIRRSRNTKRTPTVTAGLAEMWEPVRFHYDDLKHATENFSETNKLGQGGFSIVYKGVLESGLGVAVKKFTIEQIEQNMLGFENELVLLSNTRHRNLVTLLGYCRKDSDLLLVYEHMEKGSLHSILFGGRCEILSWRQRFDVIIGIARGLAYLHEDFYVHIIHRDIKCGNVLLDDKLQPKIGDFGLARLFPEDKSRVKTTLAGTLGYTAPEYFFGGQLSEKVDTYSFGIVVLEIISRRKCTDPSFEPYLLEWAWRLYESDTLLELVDEALELVSTFEAEELKKVIQIGLMCTQSSHLRPAMSAVVAKLLSGEYSKLKLLRPSFIHNKPNSKVGNESPFPPDSSINGALTMSDITPR